MRKYYLFIIFNIFFLLLHCKSEHKNRLDTNDTHIETKSDTLEFEPKYINEVSSLGIGVANPKDFAFTLYSDTLQLKLINIEDIENQKIITPLIYKPDYLLFYMVVVEQGKKWSKIIYNHNKIGYISNKEFTFYTWDNLLKSTNSVVVKEGYREKGKEETLQQLSEQDTYLIEKIDTDWIYIRKETEENILEENGYWVKWRDKNKLNIKPIFMN